MEIVLINDAYAAEVDEAIDQANSLQNQFHYIRLDKQSEQRFQMLAFNTVYAPDLFSMMSTPIKEIRGYHPFLLAIIDVLLEDDGGYDIFSSIDTDSGLGILTTSGVPDEIIPEERIVSYFLYYFARFAHCFIDPNYENHDEPAPEGCYYDSKLDKMDLLKSMRGGAFCNDCRERLVNGHEMLSPLQFGALQALFSKSGEIVKGSLGSEQISEPVFISYSQGDIANYTAFSGSLEHAGINYWNTESLKPGLSLADQLQNAIRGCSLCIYILTQSSAKSKWCLAEVGAFWGAGKNVFVYKADPNIDDEDMPPLLKGVFLMEDTRKLINQVKDALGISNGLE